MAAAGDGRADQASASAPETTFRRSLSSVCSWKFDGRAAIVGCSFDDNKVILSWRAGEKLVEIDMEIAWPITVVVLDNGVSKYLLVACRKNQILAWNPTTSAWNGLWKTVDSEELQSSICLLDDHTTLISGGTKGTLRTFGFSVQSGTPKLQMGGIPPRFRHEPRKGPGPFAHLKLCAIPGRRFASGSLDHTIQVWSMTMDGGANMDLQLDHGCGVVSLTPVDTRHLASGGVDGSIKVWDLSNDRKFQNPIITIQPHSSNADRTDVNGLCTVGRCLFSGGFDGTIKGWKLDVKTRTVELFQEWRAHDGGVTAISAGPENGTLVSGGNDCKLRLWKVPFASPAV